jgi:hypothetical protein
MLISFVRRVMSREENKRVEFAGDKQKKLEGGNKAEIKGRGGGSGGGSQKLKVKVSHRKSQ